MTDTRAIAPRAEELKAAFDIGFALAPSAQERVGFEDFLAIRAGRNPYALRLRDISGVVSNRKIAYLPSTVPAFLGVVGIRGTIFPAYRLAALLNGNAASEETKWLAICKTEEPLVLGFSELEGYLRIPSSEIQATQRGAEVWEYVRETVRAGGAVRPVICVPAAVQAIIDRLGERRAQKER